MELPDDITKGTPHRYVEGVIQTKIPYTNNFCFHTTAIASQAIRNRNKKAIRWLVDNIESDGTYQHYFVFPYYENFKRPWTGGLSQGLAIYALVKEYEYSGEKKLLETAFKAFEGLMNHCTMIINKEIWITEYPEIRILNGFLYAVLAIQRLERYDPEKVRPFLNSCLSTLANNLYKYGTDRWSLYDLEQRIPSSEFYHKVHVDLLLIISLGKISPSQRDTFLYYYDKWKKQLDKISCRLIAKFNRNRAIIHKNGIIGSYKKYKERKKWLK